ncbi:MAG: FGGY-family carbohydrate kinase [Clostridiales bacterium]|nr:FGGY-family carbohydrate kinase [Clostridiales bacterium]
MNFLTCDLGASNGRVVLASLDGGRIEMQELHRFPNDPVRTRTHLHWDTLRLLYEIQQGLVICRNQMGFLPDSIGINTWGVDFGLVDSEGDLVFTPIHYRDEARDAIAAEVEKIVSSEQSFYNTGYNAISSIESLAYLFKNKKNLVDAADRILFTPDLLSFLLCGRQYAERSISTTSKLMDVETGQWSIPSLDALGIDPGHFPEIVEPGTAMGRVDGKILDGLGLEGDIDVVAVAGHDTTSAAAAVPFTEDKYAYISCGTWSTVGAPAPKVVRSREVFDSKGSYDYSVNGGVDMRINITGLWIQQELRRQWAQKGEAYGYQELAELSAAADPHIAVIDPDAGMFFLSGNMAEKVKGFCADTGQRVPGSVGEINRVVIESLALKYRYTIERAEGLLDAGLPVIYMIGGGIQNEQLCRFTASACQRVVKTGPVEATTIGNFLMQAIAKGAVSGMEEGRELVRNSCEAHCYSPQDTDIWERQYNVAKGIFERGA